MGDPAAEPRWSAAPLVWDSEFFGCAVGMVGVDAGTSASLAACLEPFDMAYLLCEGGNIAAIHEAEALGFRMVDLRCAVELRRPSDCPAPDGVHIRPPEPAELPIVADLAAQLHDNTRFAQDRSIAGDQVGELYRRYLLRDAAAEGWAVQVAVLGDELVGYVTHGPRDRVADARTGTIGLIGVAPTARRGGLGRALVDAAVRAEASAGRPAMTVITQGGSRGSLAMYERAGFAVVSVDVWLHWHRARGDG